MALEANSKKNKQKTFGVYSRQNEKKSIDKHIHWKEMWVKGVLFLFLLNMDKLQFGAIRMFPIDDLRDEGDDHRSEVTE